ncbi:hypothetical protein FA10DRAFT_229614 [Acaromyces ingoldii]|uniref:Uncharacterized protein n=1 Tax=Acaromyces ingoldii TaxID=215250 RepID=A0A316YST9_9BASI|nr:hypothetical protein FA10DRAFT_229614 [Acaromyces ingoldii]PWN90795.1 hypothetical protein FA10DRAFT_229614 [Acaromyces ingoldii]
MRLRARQEGRFPSTTSFETDGERRRSYARARDEAHAALQDHSSRTTASVSISRHMNSTNTTEQSSRDRTSRSSKSGEPQHRVYLINCKSCGSFLTDRGMKAVLLLKPHITLYSTDAVPNCGTLCPPSRFSDGTASANEPAVERTCDCLTQTLGCYGCGAAVGYHIVAPCERCTSSVAKHQRSSNGHRTVLHCAEIAVRERRYVPGEPGVRVAPFTWAPAPPSTADRHTPTDITSTPVWRPPLAQHAFSHNRFLSNNRSFDSGGEAFTSTRPPSSDAYMRDYGEEEEDDDDDDELEDCDAEKPESSTMQAAAAAASAAAKEARHLKRGDVVYWSDLVSGGERCEPIDSDEYLDMPVAGR